MNFLAKNNFDFNKLFYDGIFYTRRDRLEMFRKEERIGELRKEMKRSRNLESPETKAFIGMHFGRVVEWI